MDARRRRVLRGADRVLTVLLCAALAVFALIMTVLGRVLGMAADVCGDVYRCSFGQIGAGSGIAAFGPLLVGAATIIGVVVLWGRGRWTWPLALVGAAAAFGLVVLGQVLIEGAIVRG